MKKNNTDGPDNKLVGFIVNLLLLLVITICTSFAISICLVKVAYYKGIWFGIGIMSLVILLTILGFFRSCVSNEEFKQMYEDAKREAEEKRKEKEENKRKNKE